MNKFFIVLVALALVACDSDLDALIFQQFQKFMKKYKKKYSSVGCINLLVEFIVIGLEWEQTWIGVIPIIEPTQSKSAIGGGKSLDSLILRF